MRRIIKVLPLVLCSLFLFSCASNKFTDTMSKMADVADFVGDDTASFVFKATSKVSKAVEDITPENEYWIGRSVAASILNKYRPYDNEEQENYVNKIAQALVYNSDMPEIYGGYHVKILNTSEMNAFATSGGHIFITRGLIECAKTEDALAAAIAHEIGHIQLKHSTKVIKSSRITDAALATTQAALSLNDKKKVAKAMDDTVNDMFNQLVTSGYSQSQEFDADEYAMNLMDAAGYNPSEILSLLDYMKKNETDDSSGMFQTHPAPSERVRKAEKVLETLGSKNKTNKNRTERYKQIML